MPTSETIPYVAEVMGATSYEENVEEGGEIKKVGEVKRVQRKLTGQEHKQPDLDREEEFAEYQGKRGVIGRPGVDFPVLPSIPRTEFSCRNVKSSGYYADLDTGCQVFHICDGGRKISFLCPNGTVFRQSHLICDWWFRVDCERSVELYEESAEQLAHDQMVYKKRAEEIAKAMNAKTTQVPRVTSTNQQKQFRRKPRPQQQQLQQQPQLQQQLQQQPQQEQEQERQIPAETASFASNRHRFANHLENQYRQQYTATTTSTTTSNPYTERKNVYNYDSQRYQTTQKTTPSYSTSTYSGSSYSPPSYSSPSFSSPSYNEPSFNSPSYSPPSYSPPSFQEVYSNEQQSKEQYSKEEYSNEELINNNYPGSVYSSYNYSYQNADFYNNNNNYSTNYNFSSNDYDSYSSPLVGKQTVPEVKSDINNYFSNSPKTSYEPKSDFVSTVPYVSSTARTLTNSETNLFNDQTQRHNNYQQLPSSGNPLKQKTVFDVKIRPTKDFAYVELLRHEEKFNDLSKATSATPSNTSPSLSHQSSYETTSSSLSDDVVPVSKFATSSPISSELSTRHTYLPTRSTETIKQQYRTTPAPAVNRYASIHVSGTSEEIRPEIVNSLMESGVTPTSAKALHSLASYISSAAADDLGSIYDQPNNHPHVSDVILNFHSGTPATNYPQNEVTSQTPLSSPEGSLPAVLTKATKESYSYLFSDSKEQTDTKGGEDPKIPFLEIDYTTQKPKASTAPPTKGSDRDIKLRDSSELRELAQVFSRALSAYLEDPETFKEILAQVRPTEPSNIEHTTPSLEDEVLDFSDARQGRKGTTGSPSNTGFTDDHLNIGDINSLASAGRTYEPDNSLEHNTFPPEMIAPEEYEQAHFTSVTPNSIQFNINGISNNTDSIDYYSRLGSKEDQSYFPTVGGVGDTSRPRYGGFQNNTQKIGRTYAPYGADVPKNLTGTPISVTTPVVHTDIPLVASASNTSEISKALPEPIDVNSLIKNNVLNSDHTSSEENVDVSYQTSPSAFPEDTFYPSADQEKVLLTSGSQSLVSSDNYLQFAKKFNEQSQKEGSKYYPEFYKSNPYTNYAPSAGSQETGSVTGNHKSEEFFPFFGQEPPFENFAKPSGFQTNKATDDTKQESNENKQNNSYSQSFGIFSDPINYHIGTINDGLATPSYDDLHRNSEYKVSYKNVNLGNGVTLEKHDTSTESRNYESGWTVSPLIDLTTAGGSTLHFNHTSSPVPSSSIHYLSTQQFEATTYRPPRSSESSETEYQWGTTVQTEISSDEPLTTTNQNDFTETLMSNESGSFERTAKDMFGNLNETAAVTLMNMMSKAENNMTIRRLVLLLVNEKGKENRTAKESRENLINALLTNMEDHTTTQAPLSAYPSSVQSVQIPRKKVRVSRVRVSSTTLPPQSSAKFYRGTETMTSVHGSVQSPSDINKINSAKLYIPSPSVAAYTNTLPIDSDARAVELLRTLYSLAAKWG